MPQLLLELLTEEIPARMQARACADLERALMDHLSAAGLLPEGVKAFATPRRLAAVVEGLPLRTPDTHEERKGPRVDAPAPAIEGFLRGAGLASLDQARRVDDPKKGSFWVADIRREGRDTPALIAEIVPAIIRAFPWPKSMRWGEGDLMWVRPLQAIVCTFDGEVVDFAIAGLRSGDVTRGHRVHAPDPVRVRRYEDYVTALERARVVLDAEDRRARIAADARTACEALGLELVDDPGLLDEVAGLVEWPVVVVGEMDPAFLDLPAELIRLTMRTNQKYFAVRDPATGRLAPRFVTVANLAARDGGKAIAAGNARVLSARLSDARFFVEVDRATTLESRVPRLSSIVFHERLGTMGEKVERVRTLASALCHDTGAPPDLVDHAARLCKADLVTEVVGEFPELQGQVGRDLARHEGLADAVAIAIEEHWKPAGPSDRVPTNPVGVTVALADKLDTLMSFWRIGEKPTGSRDPYALRRAALGVIRILRERRVRLRLRTAFKGRLDDALADDLLQFMHERLKQALRDEGSRHDLVDAAMPFESKLVDVATETQSPEGQKYAVPDDDLVMIADRVEALANFLSTENGVNLLTGYRRARNILDAEWAKENKKGAHLGWQMIGVERAFDVRTQPEQELILAIQSIRTTISGNFHNAEREDWVAILGALSSLRGPVDRFFETTRVNDPEPQVRLNRLKLLDELCSACETVARFSLVAG
jgi:glycyl-tRNA synthetase beta chain